MKLPATVAAALCLALFCSAPAQTPLPPAPTYPAIRLPTWSQGIALREGWLTQRHAMLLDMMRRHGIDMWIVVNEEFHNDPLTEYIAPPRPYTGNRDLFVFIDTGTTLRKIAITGYAEENVQRFFEEPDDPKPPPRSSPRSTRSTTPNTSASPSTPSAACSARSRTTATPSSRKPSALKRPPISFPPPT